MNECCALLENRVEGPGLRGLDGVESRPDLVVTHCRVCGCRHFELAVEPGQLGLEGVKL